MSEQLSFVSSDIISNGKSKENCFRIGELTGRERRNKRNETDGSFTYFPFLHGNAEFFE